MRVSCASSFAYIYYKIVWCRSVRFIVVRGHKWENARVDMGVEMCGFVFVSCALKSLIPFGVKRDPSFVTLRKMDMFSVAFNDVILSQATATHSVL